jgi:hypothetical protein
MANWFVSQSTKDSIDNFNKLFQIVAVIVAAWWAIHVFGRTTEPGLEFRGTTESKITWSEGTDKSNCLGTYTASIKNDGLSSFEVKAVTVTGWLYSTSQGGNSHVASLSEGDAIQPVFIDYDLIKQSTPFSHMTFHEPGPLVWHYPPGIMAYQSWDWSFPKKPGQGVLFQVEVKTDQGKNVSPTSSVADTVCPTSKLEKKDKAE